MAPTHFHDLRPSTWQPTIINVQQRTFPFNIYLIIAFKATIFSTYILVDFPMMPCMDFTPNDSQWFGILKSLTIMEIYLKFPHIIHGCTSMLPFSSHDTSCLVLINGFLAKDLILVKVCACNIKTQIIFVSMRQELIQLLI